MIIYLRCWLINQESTGGRDLNSHSPSDRLESEKQAKKVVEHDLVGLKKIIDDTLLNKAQLESEIESTKQELAFLKKDHSDVRTTHTHKHTPQACVHTIKHSFNYIILPSPLLPLSPITGSCGPAQEG